MFDSLTEKLQSLFQRLGRKGRLTEEDVSEASRQVRLALLEADVNVRVVRDFVSRVKEQATGQQVLAGLNPTQNVVRIVHRELLALLGTEAAPLATSQRPPSVYLVVGLQGGGKTTTCGKLAGQLRKAGQKPLLVATDVARPAAIAQLMVVGTAVGVPVFQMGTRHLPADIVRAAWQHARDNGHTHLIVDTAGRLHVNEELMAQVGAVRDAVPTHEILLVLDAMTGQDAVSVATEFHERLTVTGFVLTKMDGDTRGGAALSIREVTGVPIRYLGTGEKYDALEVYHPERLASRILGMGDVVSLIEKAEQAFAGADAERLERRIAERRLDLGDFAGMLDQVTTMGPLDQVLDMIPGMAQMRRAGPIEVDPRRLKRMRAIVSSMTPRERANPDIIRGSRRRRIAAGSGTTVQDVSLLLKQFGQMQDMMGQFAALEKGGRHSRGRARFPFPLS